MPVSDVILALKKLENKEKAKFFYKFWKTGKGEYGEGDKFFGITVPEIRKVTGRFQSLPLSDLEHLLQNPVHEIRLTSVIILVKRFKEEPKKVFDLYLRNTRHINNWDLVDLSAGYIVGGYLENKSKKLLTKLARSKNMWERRIAMIATFFDIKQGRADEALRVAKILLKDKHDLIHKAVGWMLREVGKCCSETKLIKFLRENYPKLPRTTLRYAIERFPVERRKKMLAGEF